MILHDLSTYTGDTVVGYLATAVALVLILGIQFL